MACCRNISIFTSILILLIINTILLVGGILVLYAGIRLNHEGWIDVLQAHWSHTNSLVTAIIVIGAVVIGLALLGSIAALCRWRLGLLIYAWIISLICILFILIAIAAFIVYGTANHWEGKTYPASSDETTVKKKFDEVYCYAQGAYACNDMKISDALAMFVPSLHLSSLLGNLDNIKGVGELCDKYLDSISALQSVCDGCDQAKQFQNLSSVLDWANDKCPRTDDTMVWCGSFIATGSTDNSVGKAPYTQCRNEFLDFVQSLMLYMGIGGILVAVSSLFVACFSCRLRRKVKYNRDAARDRDSRYETQAYSDDPLTPSATQENYTKV